MVRTDPEDVEIVSKFLRDNQLDCALREISLSSNSTFAEPGLLAAQFEDPSLITQLSYLQAGRGVIGFYSRSDSAYTRFTANVNKEVPPDKRHWKLVTEFEERPFGGIPLNGPPGEVGPLYTPSLIDILKLTKAANLGDRRAYESRLLAIWHDPVNKALFENHQF